jgi:hypothetical protein
MAPRPQRPSRPCPPLPPTPHSQTARAFAARASEYRPAPQARARRQHPACASRNVVSIRKHTSAAYASRSVSPYPGIPVPCTLELSQCAHAFLRKSIAKCVMKSAESTTEHASRRVASCRGECALAPRSGRLRCMAAITQHAEVQVPKHSMFVPNIRCFRCEWLPLKFGRGAHMH